MSPAESDEGSLTRCIRAIVVRILEVDDAELTDTSLFHEDHGAESINEVEVLAALEEEFDIVVEDKQAARMVNVAATRQVVAELLREADASVVVP